MPKQTKRKPNRCRVGDIVICLTSMQKVMVNEVIFKGIGPMEKDMISVCRVMSNGQVLRRSPVCIDTKWRHTND